MSLLAGMQEGRVGVRFSVPEHFEVEQETSDFSMLLDKERQLVWTLHLSEHHLDLRPAHEALLRRDIERHARALFERCFQEAERPAGQTPEKPRTSDPAWSPVVEVERVQLRGAHALWVVHRMFYEPGNELMMGHVLVPLEHGLFEFRMFKNAGMTGLRESMLGLRARGEAGVNQVYFDDPRHDELFPDHPLSTVRAAKRWLLEQAKIEIATPVATGQAEEVLARHAGFAVTPPPRYALLPADDLPRLRFSRVSFATTDGVQLLTVARLPRTRSGAALTGGELLEMGEELAHDDIPHAMNPHVTAEQLPDVAGRPQVRVYCTYDEAGNGPQHTAFRWFVDESGAGVMVAVGAATCVPADELFAQAEDVVGSFRLLDAPDGGGHSAGR
jgi:hypothetical protein